MNNSDYFGDLISLTKIEQKIFKLKEIYHPNLIVNLSKEAYNLYLIRMSICDQLREQIDKKGITIKKIEYFIRNKVKESKERLNKAKDIIEIELIQLKLKNGKIFYK